MYWHFEVLWVQYDARNNRTSPFHVHNEPHYRVYMHDECLKLLDRVQLLFFLSSLHCSWLRCQHCYLRYHHLDHCSERHRIKLDMHWALTKRQRLNRLRLMHQLKQQDVLPRALSVHLLLRDELQLQPPRPKLSEAVLLRPSPELFHEVHLLSLQRFFLHGERRSPASLHDDGAVVSLHSCCPVQLESILLLDHSAAL